MKNKRLLLWCSPGFGFVDIWLPVIRKLKEQEGVVVDFVFPEPSSIRLEDENSDLFNLAEQFSDRIIFKGYSGRWFISKTLGEAKVNTRLSKIDKKIMRFSSRLKYGKLSKFHFLKTLGEYIYSMHKYIFFIKDFFNFPCLYNFASLKNTDGILCDITVEGKQANKELKHNLKNIKKFSMLHGMAATWVESHMSCDKSVRKRSDVFVYNMSNLEKNGYKKCYGILEKNIIHAGIPRHDNDWIEFICSQENSDTKKEFKSFVLIIGRAASAYNPPERKKKALEDIYNIVCTKFKLKLIVKMHPKESPDGIDGQIYRDALGSDNYGKDWMYSDRHPLLLGKGAIFAISFYSGVVLDMLSLNKISIEYLNLDGLKDYDNKNSLRDNNEKPVFQFRYTNLVLGVSSELELKRHVCSILSQNSLTLLALRLKYEEYFKVFNGSSKMVADSIINTIDANF